MTVLGKFVGDLITQVVVCPDNDQARIHECTEQGFDILATGKPEGYTIKDGWLEFNVNDMVITASNLNG